MLYDRSMESFRVQPDNDNSDHLQRTVPNCVSPPETDQKIANSFWSEYILLGVGDPSTLCCTLEIFDKNTEREDMISIYINKYIST